MTDVRDTETCTQTLPEEAVQAATRALLDRLIRPGTQTLSVAAQREIAETVLAAALPPVCEDMAMQALHERIERSDRGETGWLSWLDVADFVRRYGTTRGGAT